ncbi:hypothetical protein OAV88_02315 [bacterium]|nr:hypothetical protein [bacterium]
MSSRGGGEIQEQKLSEDDASLLGGFFRGVAASLRSSLPAIKSSVRYFLSSFLFTLRESESFHV